MPQRERSPHEAERRLTPLWEQLLRRAAGTDRVPGVLVEAWQVQLAQARKLQDPRDRLFLLENARPAPPLPGITSDHAASLTLWYCCMSGCKLRKESCRAQAMPAACGPSPGTLAAAASRRVIHHFPFRGTHTAIKLRMGGLWLELSTGGGAWGWDSDAAFFRSVKHGVVAELGLSVVTDLVPTASCPRLPDAPRAPLLPLPAAVEGMPLRVWRLAYEPHPRIFINNWHDLKAAGQKGGDATVRLLGFDADGSSIQMQLVGLASALQCERRRAAAIAATPRFVELPTLEQLGTFDEVWRRCAQGEHPWVVEEVESRARGFVTWRYVTGGSTGVVNMRWHFIASLLGLVLAEAELQDCDWETAVEWLEADRISEGMFAGWVPAVPP
ncbi:hypothetical protein ABPG77_005866 [Micractinium sp. CCAP 211/92]